MIIMALFVAHKQEVNKYGHQGIMSDIILAESISAFISPIFY